jgi:hypothetical protein
MSLAAFRWLANTIENFSIELYATDRESFPAVEQILRNTLKELRHARKQFGLSAEDDCPDGYVLCHGVCSPSCDMEMYEVTASKRAARTKDKGKKR